jgi:hypothetical protein
MFFLKPFGGLGEARVQQWWSVGENNEKVLGGWRTIRRVVSLVELMSVDRCVEMGGQTQTS